MSDEKPEESVEDVIEGEIVSDAGEQLASESGEPARVAKSGISLGAKLGWGTAFVLSAFIGGIFAEPWISDRLVSLGLKEAPVVVSEPDNHAALSDLQARLDAQEARMREMAGTIANQSGEIADTRSRAEKAENDLALLAASSGTGGDGGGAPAVAPAIVESLQGEIASLRETLAEREASNETNVDVTALQGRLEIARAETGVLKDRLATLEAGLADINQGNLATSPRGRLALKLSELHRRADAGQGFGDTLAAVRLDLTMLPALDQQKAGSAMSVLEQNAAGVASHSELVNRFPGLVRAVKIGAAEGTSESWMTSLFVTRDKSADEDSVDGVLNRAEIHLRARDLKGALETLSVLEGGAGEATTEWGDMARSRAAVLAASDQLFQLAAGASAAAAPEQAASNAS